MEAGETPSLSEPSKSSLASAMAPTSSGTRVGYAGLVETDVSVDGKISITNMVTMESQRVDNFGEWEIVYDDSGNAVYNTCSEDGERSISLDLDDVFNRHLFDGGDDGMLITWHKQALRHHVYHHYQYRHNYSEHRLHHRPHQ